MNHRNGKYKPSEVAILNVTEDGRVHPVRDFLEVLGVSSSHNTLKVQISGLRKKLRGVGQDIVYVNAGNLRGYQRVRLLVNPNDGRH